MEKKKSRISLILKIVGVILALLLVCGILKIAPDYKRNDIRDKANLVINNNNVTGSLKKDIFIENGIVYIAKEDISNFFDRYLYNDKENKLMITTSDTKIGVIAYDSKELLINGSKTTMLGKLIERNDTIYLPFSEMQNVYNVKVDQLDSEGNPTIVTVDSLDREYITADVAKNVDVKVKAKDLCRTVAKLKKGDKVVWVSELENGWVKVRTDKGLLGYVKANKLANKFYAREKMEEQPQVSGKVNLVWDYYSEYVSAPTRTGTAMDGLNVVSPSFFSLVKSGKGEIEENIGTKGQAYLDWAKSNNYKIWAMVSNNSMKETTSEIMNSYESRQKLIENIVNLAVKYKLDGINIDFENMYEKDKNMYSRFIIELAPRLKECGMVLSVDVTAPDGDPSWSLCFDRNVIGYVADYIVFMAYDQHGKNTEAGSVAAYDWVKANVNKFLGQEGVKPEKLILGLPFYTRLWEEKNGTTDSSTVDMKDVSKVLPQEVNPTWKDDVKQNYVEYTEGNSTYKMWIEDEQSIKAKISIVTEKGLAGIASWEKDREPDSIWSVIKEELNK